MHTYKAQQLLRADEKINVVKYGYSAEAKEQVHTHEFIEIAFIMSGSGLHLNNGSSFYLERGDLLFINFTQTYSFYTKRAFVESDKYKLIDIGLSYIPVDCGVAKGIRTAIESYKSGVSFEDARIRVMNAVPGSFGIQFMPTAKVEEKAFPLGQPGWDAPSNIGIMIIGWLYGEDDFGKSLCIAVNCGEDTDCTAATLGSILGIIHGASGIPDKWTEPLGDVINTMCINWINGVITIPKTVTELTERCLRLTPLFLGSKLCDLLRGMDGYTIEVLEGQDLYYQKGDLYVPGINGYWKIEESGNEQLLQSIYGEIGSC